MIGLISGGRPSPADSGEEPVRIEYDIVIVAIGRGLNPEHLRTPAFSSKAWRYLRRQLERY